MRLLDRIKCADIYSLEWYDGKIYIHVHGYYYDAGFSLENDGKNWRYNEYSGYTMPLTEYLVMTDDDRANWEEICTRWVDDFSEEELLEYFTSDDAPIPLFPSEVTETDVKDCTYIDVIY